VRPSYRFGEFELDGRGYRLTRGDVAIELPPKALDLLFLLASRPAALVSKDEILDALWPGVSVTDNAITQVVSELRQALGDSPASPGFIQTEMVDSIPERVKQRLLDQVPLRRFGTAAEVARAVIFLVSSDGDYITGEELSMNGGLLMR